jgi:hypothetical protein
VGECARRLLATIAQRGAVDLSCTPYPGAWSVQRPPLHIAQEEHGECGCGVALTLRRFRPPTRLRNIVR